MKENEKTTPPFLGDPEPQEWSPPAPPWSPEPEPLDLSGEPSDPRLEGTGQEETEPVNMGLEAKIEEMVEDGDLRIEAHPSGNGVPVTEEFSEFTAEDNGIGVNDLFFFIIKANTGITLNGVHFPAGGYWFNEETYEGIEAIDAPFQEE